MKNYGLDLKREGLEQDGSELLAGVLPPCLARGLDRLSFEEQKKYFPMGEVQRTSKGDMQDCVARAFNNELETKMNFLIGTGLLSAEQVLWLNRVGFINSDGKFESSDAFPAINSKTTKKGNSLKAPPLAIHKHGLVPKKLLPLGEDMTWEEYHNPERITNSMVEIGKKFKEVIGEIFFGKEYNFNSKKGLITGLYAWSDYDENGVYQRVEYPLSHAVYLPSSDDPTILKHALDNYRDSFDGDFIKKLAPDYKLYNYGYKVVIGPPKQPEERVNWLTASWRGLIKFISSIIGL